MYVDRPEAGEGFEVVFDEPEQIHSVGVGLLLLEYFSDDKNIGVCMGIMRYDGKDPESGGTERYVMDTSNPHEKILLSGLVRVAREKEEYSSKVFHEENVLHGVEKAFGQLERADLGEHMDKLNSIVDQLVEENVVEDIVSKG